MEIARVRIGRVRLKTGGAEISVFPAPSDLDETNFVSTLVWILDRARKGRVTGYAIVFSLEGDDGCVRCIEAAKEWEDGDAHHVLGLIRRLEVNYMKRTWEDS